VRNKQLITELYCDSHHIKRADAFGFHPNLAESHLKNGSTLRTFGPILIETLPAVDNLVAIRMRPSIPQKINIRFFAPFDKGTFTAIINEGHQTSRSVHPGFSSFTNFTGETNAIYITQCGAENRKMQKQEFKS
jgi:hypothetical protein